MKIVMIRQEEKPNLILILNSHSTLSPTFTWQDNVTKAEH